MAKREVKNQEVVSNYVEEVLKRLNKPEEDVQRESVIKDIQFCAIECEEQIAATEADLKKLKVNLKGAKSRLTIAEKAKEDSYYTPASSYSSFVSRINSKIDAINAVKMEIAQLESRIATKESDLAKHNYNLSILQS